MKPQSTLPPTPAPGLQRLTGESVIKHRALILYALGGEARNIRATSRAIGINEATVRYWKKVYEWQRRLDETADSDVAAYLLYQQEYLPFFGADPVVRLVKNLVKPMGLLAQLDEEELRKDAKIARQEAKARGVDVDASPDVPKKTIKRPAPPPDPRLLQGIALRERGWDKRTPANERVARRVLEAAGIDLEPPRTLPERRVIEVGPDESVYVEEEPRGSTQAHAAVEAALAAPTQPVDPEEEKRRVSQSRDEMLVDGALGYAAKALKDGKVPVTLGGIATLLKVKRLMQGQSTDHVAVVVGAHGTAAPVPSVRVQLAGDDPDKKLEAYADDLADLTVVVEQLRVKRELDRVAVTTLQEARRA